jgi:hypothetical protein
MLTVPVGLMTMRSLLEVKILTGIPLVVPSLEVAVALLLPTELQNGAVFWA